MRKALFILLMLGTFAAWSCQKETLAEEVASGSGSIELRLNSGKAITLQTKATNLEEGLEFKNVLVILVNNSGNVVGNVYKTYPYTPVSGDIQDAESATSVSEDVIHFNGLLPGNYHVYAYANIDAATWQNSGSLIANQEKGVAVGSAFSGFTDRELAQLTGTSVPADPSTSMLLTGHKDILVGLTRVPETLDLLRPVVRFKVTVRNNAPFPVSVDQLSFSKFNPDKAYLVDHIDGSGVPSVPAGVTYREMPAFGSAASDDSAVAADTSEVVYQRLIYENASPNHYKIYVSMTLDRSSSGSGSNLSLNLGDRPFGVIDYTTLNEMNDGEQVDVLLVNPQISVRSGRIFCYISSDNNMVWESAGYENYNGFHSRALAIWNEVSDYDYSSRYSGFTNANGYSGWDGINNSAGSQSNHFYYTGARSKYFHTLTKSNGTFSLSGLALQQGNKNDNGKCLTAITGLQIEKGASYKKNNEWKNPEDMSSDLVRLKMDSKYIQADALWSANSPNIKTNLKLFAGSETTGDRQFAFFGKYLAGGPLKRILKDNNKEVPLTYMARNEEINVTINVYYSDQEGTLNFTVDNSTWKTATTVTHTFK